MSSLMDPNIEPYLSQASSHFTIEPVSGETLLDLEIARREKLRHSGNLRTGCKDLDDYVLLGGIERGCVVGVTAEDVDVGLLIAFQTIAQTLLSKPTARRRVAVITTLAAPAILPTLRDVIKAQVREQSGQSTSDESAQIKRCLESISISRVFDIEGLWEVLSELEKPSQPSPRDESGGRHPQEDEVAEPPESSQRSPPPTASPAVTLPPLRIERTEIADSEDEDEDLRSSSASNSTGLARTDPENQAIPDGSTQEVVDPTPGAQPGFPDIILVTHFSALLTALFTQRDKSSAHASLQVLSSHLRYLSRSSDSVIMLANVTTSPFTKASSGTSTTTVYPGELQKHDKPLDPTLRSIFNPPPPTTNAYGSVGLALSRRNKPAFGLTFSQFLDLHLLCTRVPRTREDAEAVYAPASHARGDGREVRFVWVVEVLLDDIGTWEAGRAGTQSGALLEGKRSDREQRWCAVEVKDGIRIVGAFKTEEQRGNMAPIRLAAGFGGPRV